MQQYNINLNLFDTESQWKLNLAEKRNRKSNKSLKNRQEED